MANTTYEDVLSSFESLPQTKVVLADGLLKRWFLDCISLYELETESLGFNEDSNEFDSKLPNYKIKTISLMMYCEFLTRELNRIVKLNGFYGKDIQMTGADGSKRVALADLQLELERVERLLHKQKQHSFG